MINAVEFAGGVIRCYVERKKSEERPKNVKYKVRE